MNRDANPHDSTDECAAERRDASCSSAPWWCPSWRRRARSPPAPAAPAGKSAALGEPTVRRRRVAADDQRAAHSYTDERAETKLASGRVEDDQGSSNSERESVLSGKRRLARRSDERKRSDRTPRRTGHMSRMNRWQDVIDSSFVSGLGRLSLLPWSTAASPLAFPVVRRPTSLCCRCCSQHGQRVAGERRTAHGTQGSRGTYCCRRWHHPRPAV